MHYSTILYKIRYLWYENSLNEVTLHSHVLKNQENHLPSEYISATKEARTNPFLYQVVKLGFDFFKDYSKPSCLRYKNIHPGRKPNEPTVTDIRALN